MTILFVKNSEEIISNSFVNNVREINSQKKERINQLLKVYSNKVVLLSEVQALKSLIQDNQDNKDFQKSKIELENLFTKQLLLDHLIYKIRFIDDNGIETIKVTRDIYGNIQPISKSSLQDKSAIYYFSESIKKKKNEVFISKIDLNEEFGNVSLPYIPTIRFAVPVYNKKNIIKGVVIFNVDLKSLFTSLNRQENIQTLMIDQDGQYLLHPQKSKEFSKQLNHAYNFFLDYPNFKESLSEKNFSDNVVIQNNILRVWNLIYPNPNDKTYYWVMLSKVDDIDSLSHANRLKKYSFFVMFSFSVISIFLAFFISRNIGKPIQKLTKVARKISRGNFNFRSGELDLIEGENEITLLSIAMNRMVENLKANFEKLDLLMRKEEDQRKFSELIIENSPSGLILVNSKGAITLVNSAINQVFGYDEEELIGHQIEVLIPDLIRDRHKELRKSYLSQPKKRSMGEGRDLFGKSKTGKLIPVEIGLNPLIIGEEKYVLAAFSDISERKKHEEKIKKYMNDLEKSHEELEQFSFIASHDLQEPLRKIQGFTEIIEEEYSGNLDDQGKKYLSKIESSAFRMSELISALLSYSRVSKSDHEFEKVSLNNILDEAISNLEIAISESQASINKVDLPEIEGIQIQLVQLFQNILSNSIKYIEKDTKPKIKISLNEFDNNMIEIIISDNGIGIKKENIDKIFKPFKRLHRQEVYKGTGIGLALCLKIIQKHKGNIRVESELGMGTNFILTIPRTQSQST